MIKAYAHIYTLTLLLSTLLLTACSGWELRGGNNANTITKLIYMPKSNARVYEQLQQSLAQRALLVMRQEADVELQIHTEFFDRETISTNTSNNTKQYQLTLSVNYELINVSNNESLLRRDVESIRYYTYNQDAINGSEREEAQIVTAMTRQITQRILQQIQHYTID